MSDALEREIGQDAMAKVRAAGWTPPPPKPEPKRLVTLEESRERYYRLGGAKEGFTYAQTAYNAADDWLVKAVNRRIIEGLQSPLRGWLLHHFCGEEAP